MGDGGGQAANRWRGRLGRDHKGNLSLAIYLIAVPLSFFHNGISQGLYVLVALMWLIPDRRIEKAIQPNL